MRLALVLSSALALLPASAGAHRIDLDGGRHTLEPVVRGPLAVLPVVADRIGEAPDVVTFDEASKAGTVRVEEVSQSGTVNRLVVTNRDRRPLLILAGEVVQGGKQDRILGQDTVLAPRERLEVQAFCVEHGRWNRQGNFENAGQAANAKVRFAAKSGDQSGVWAEVDKKLASTGATSATHTLRAATDKARGTTEQAIRELGAALDRLPARDRGRIVGYVASVAGKVVSVDTFAHPSLAARYRSKLLRSYVLEAEGTAASPTPAAPAAEEVAGLRRKLDAAKAGKQKDRRAGYVLESERGEEVVRTRVVGSKGEPLVDSIQTR